MNANTTRFLNSINTEDIEGLDHFDKWLAIVELAIDYGRKGEKDAHANRIAEIDRQVEEICGPLTEQEGRWEKR